MPSRTSTSQRIPRCARACSSGPDGRRRIRMGAAGLQTDDTRQHGPEAHVARLACACRRRGSDWQWHGRSPRRRPHRPWHRGHGPGGSRSVVRHPPSGTGPDGSGPWSDRRRADRCWTAAAPRRSSAAPERVEIAHAVAEAADIVQTGLFRPASQERLADVLTVLGLELIQGGDPLAFRHDAASPLVGGRRGQGAEASEH